MTNEAKKKLLERLRLEIFKQEKFLIAVSRIQSLPPRARKEAVKNACWIDGTLPTQVAYAQRKRAKFIELQTKLHNEKIQDNREN